MDDVEVAVEAALFKLDLAGKVRLLSGHDFWSLPAEPAIGLRSLVMSDGTVGVRGTGWAPDQPSIVLPCPTALAATWDPDLARLAGATVGAQARRRGIHLLLSPMVNLHRSPLSGRHFECYSEDPLLSGVIGAAFVEGVQSMGVGATVKHFVCNDSETDRLTVDVWVPERALRERYLAPFETIVRQARPYAVMAAYNRVNGTPMTEHTRLLRDILKEEWGFDGVVLSDWSAARSTVATALGGLDVAMPALGQPWGDALVAAVREGKVDEGIVDEQARRVLRLAARVGVLGKRAEPMPEVPDSSVTKQIAVRSFVLLRNNGVLPLEAAQRVAVIGALARDTVVQGGGSAQVFGQPAVSYLDGLQARMDVTFALGADPRSFLPAATKGKQWTPFTASLHGSRLHQTHLSTATIRWMGSYPGGPGLREIRLAGRLTPEAGGVHELAVSGFGVFTLTVAGHVIWHGPLYPPDCDPALIFLASAEHRVPVELTAGQTVDVVLTQHVRDELSTAFVAMTLGHRPPMPDPDTLLAEAEQAAREADVAVVVVGTTDETETEGADRTTLALPGRQDELVRRVVAANPDTIVVVNAGSPVLMPWADDVAAILLTWFPGQEGGNALADVLLGVEEPGGRLPTTWPADEDVPSTTPVDGVLAYEADEEETRIRPLFRFGHGLGYTTWAIEKHGTAGVMVRNTGARAGREVVQVYVRGKLADFATVQAKPGQAVTVRLEVT